MSKVIALLLVCALLLGAGLSALAADPMGILVAHTKPGAEVLVGCDSIQIGGIANSKGVFTHEFPIGPNCVNSLGIQIPVTFAPGEVTTVYFINNVYLPLISN